MPHPDDAGRNTPDRVTGEERLEAAESARAMAVGNGSAEESMFFALIYVGDCLSAIARLMIERES